MKYIVILGDGMADEPISALGDKTPLEYADTRTMDLLASMGQIGLARTVPPSMKPGSDVANLCVMGYDPVSCYSGRSPLEALSVGVPMRQEDVILRCNMVTVTDEEPFAQKTILDHSSGEISTEDADVLMDAVRKAFNNETFSFYTGTSYRHVTVWKGGEVIDDLIPPHDHLGECISSYLPKNKDLLDMMQRSYEILDGHPINKKRAAEGKNKANALWFWGAGTKPSLSSFEKKTGLKGAMISAVDLLKGIAVGSGMRVIDVPGATGGLHTNYSGKAKAAVKALLEEGADYVYIHVEAPDEMGHQGSIEKKIQAIEMIDREVVAVVKAAMDASKEPYRMLICPDHPTPIRCRTHTSDPVPYILYDSRYNNNTGMCYNEREAAASGNYEKDGFKMLNRLLEK